MSRRLPAGPPPVEFARRVEESLERFLRQNGLPALPKSDQTSLVGRLWDLMVDRGLPEPLADGDPGQPGELGEAETASAIARVMGELPKSAPEPLAIAIRQLVKACFNPEFANCRNTFREASPDGNCRRQELGRARRRLSGAHCVDCPYWTLLSPSEHRLFLAGEWQPANRADFEAHAEIFLPEDFRRLRVYLHDLARRPPAP